MSGDSSLTPSFAAAPVREVVRISVEGELLDPSLREWDRAYLRRVCSTGPLRGRSRDRLVSLGQAWFDASLKPRLLYAGVARIRAARKAGKIVVLESTGFETVVRPLARHLAADRFVARHLEFRDGIATGRVPDTTEECDVWPRLGRVAAPVLVDGPVPPPPLDVRAALSGRDLFVIGGSGFIGKVWLAEVLLNIPDVNIRLMMRRRGSRAPQKRWQRMLRESHVFGELRRRIGPDPAAALGDRVRIVEGDIRRPGLGLAAEDRDALGTADLIVNCAGLTDFNPDPRAALDINVECVRHLLDIAEEHPGTRLLHVSTCFVAGQREGRIPESITADDTPNGTAPFDAEEETARLRSTIEEHRREARAAGRPVRTALTRAVRRRARELGWPNIYTYTKALGEGLIARRLARRPELRCAVVRPSIVESALSFPMRGWNEGVNTSAPLSHLLGTHFRQLPVNRRKRLDVIPVDCISRGLTLVSAALLTDRHEVTYQLATSASNPLDLRRAVELTSLAHREHYRSRPGWRSRVLARLEAVPVSRERYLRWSVPMQLRALRKLNGWLAPLRGGRAPFQGSERKLTQVKELIDLYEPFLLDNEPVFVADHVERLTAALPAEDREAFGYDVRSLDWYDYWVNVHIPGLRRWSYPLIEGRPLEITAVPSRDADAATSAGVAGPARNQAVSRPGPDS